MVHVAVKEVAAVPLVVVVLLVAEEFGLEFAVALAAVVAVAVVPALAVVVAVVGLAVDAVAPERSHSEKDV